MKVEKKKKNGYLLELIIKIQQFEKRRKIFKIWRIWVIFSMRHPLYMSKSYFSSQNFAKIRQ